MLTLLLNVNPADLMFYDFYLEKQVLLDKFVMILKKLYRMPEAELSEDEGQYPFFSVYSNCFIYQINLFLG